MRNLFLLFITTLVLFSCKKENKNNVKFAVNGIADLTLSQGGLGVLGLTITGDQQVVDLSISGMPSSVTGVFSSSSGTPIFTSALTLNASSTAPDGVYPLVLTAKSGETVKTYNFNLNIKTCLADKYFGRKEVVETCNANEYKYDVILFKENDTRFYISNIYKISSLEIYADFQCLTKKIIIPSQPFFSSTAFIFGDGEIVDGYMIIRYTINTNQGDSDACEMKIDLNQ